jgi:phosphoribosyl 1,2-cyclic phosphate phosphodiesterase
VKVTFLGTGTSQGVPVIGCRCAVCRSTDYRDQRLRVSVLIEENGRNLVIDTGPDFRQQMLRHRVQRLDAIVFTHEHKDHTAGMDDIRSYNFIQKKKIPLFATERVVNQLKREFYYVFEDTKYPGVPEVDVHLIDQEPFTAAGMLLTPIQVMHYMLPVKGFRVGDFTYITDANYISEEEQQKIKGSRVIVLNGLQQEPHISHYTLKQAVELLESWAPEVGYLTHISHKLGLQVEIERNLPINIRLAYDGLCIEI